ETDRPVAGLTDGVFPCAADTHFGHLTAPTAPAGRPLVTESAYIIAPVVTDVAKTRDVQSIGPTAVIILIQVAFDASVGPAAEVVVHRVMAEFTAAAAQTTFPDIRR